MANAVNSWLNSGENLMFRFGDAPGLARPESGGTILGGSEAEHVTERAARRERGIGTIPVLNGAERLTHLPF